ncbi:MAG TPA: prepilin-type N-terminal cleavage/methylation domain-containing protein [Luteimonas sp.]|nr:prepilin-type N-terminal cleavage/methylation domain-containing protein [Luteimonas sp.]HRO26574.1 prepilin-type N-terminal cleavage/methylation domain-containing protein [Luteimonas sp.]HRP72571.1 prepilin-type N-terminal cleavage/methylation domain-containing protein [Luteimonas sp.]
MKRTMTTGAARRAQAGASLHRARHMRGISLIEVMVSVVIIAIGLLGIAAMQSVALRGSQGSLETSQAVMQTNAIMEAMRANRRNADDYNTAGMVCTATLGVSLVENDLSSWITALKASIGTAADVTTCGQIAGCPDACVVTVQWDDQRAGGGTTRQVVTETRI